ncbi:hypothetical protein NGM10_16120 (plasmid) [Halorussus salilacus]|uniref:hypothetical protein n=1 Tax=Halorussus salilacus TaxID=2953750 RepID=UPI0020A1D67A|nr:hypothetical protein [Halorussus salilacus]USZ69928.1 hypothetical protein NGM10_16120 [Halorussus salilacus]
MARQTRTGGDSTLGRLLALALTFAVGYALGAWRTGESEPWTEGREPTEIPIDGDSAERGSAESPDGDTANSEGGVGGEGEEGGEVRDQEGEGANE